MSEFDPLQFKSAKLVGPPPLPLLQVHSFHGTSAPPPLPPLTISPWPYWLIAASKDGSTEFASKVQLSMVKCYMSPLNEC